MLECPWLFAVMKDLVPRSGNVETMVRPENHAKPRNRMIGRIASTILPSLHKMNLTGDPVTWATMSCPEPVYKSWAVFSSLCTL